PIATVRPTASNAAAGAGAAATAAASHARHMYLRAGVSNEDTMPAPATSVPTGVSSRTIASAPPASWRSTTATNRSSRAAVVKAIAMAAKRPRLVVHHRDALQSASKVSPGVNASNVQAMPRPQNSGLAARLIDD